MSDEDKELEKLKAKRLAEMKKNISFKQQQEKYSTTLQEKHKNTLNPRDILIGRLGYRGLEVLQNAEAQYPNEAKLVVEKLAELITSGDITEEIDGGKLLLLFRTVGLNVRVKTTINVEQDGKFVSLSEKLSSKYSSSKDLSSNEESKN